MIILPQKTLDQYDIWAFYEHVFTPEECEKLRSSFNFKEAEQAAVQGGVNNSIRSSLVNWIKPSEMQWVFDKIARVAISCNDARWKFQLTGFLEGIQFGHYGQGGFYNWHQDNGNQEYSKRKLSMVVQLSDPSEYAGGELEFIIGGKAHKGLGSVIIFPSYQIHRVTPVMSGSRFSMAAWISGDSYK